ncbi:MAG: hypothetical protein JRH11_17410 [Deltaproteobacteria bacterium]|nr:hypothetical protein [Deltaproteobacteria bacterium]
MFEHRGSRLFNLSAYEGIPYNDASVQAIADQLFERTQDGALPSLGADFAQVLIPATELARPPQSWVLTDFCWRLVVLSDTPAAVAGLGESMRLLRDVHRIGLDRIGSALPAHHSALILATADELAAYEQELLSLEAVPLDMQPGPREVLAQVTRLPSGALAIFITGRSESELVAGAEYLAAHHDEMGIPAVGWHTLIAKSE